MENEESLNDFRRALSRRIPFPINVPLYSRKDLSVLLSKFEALERRGLITKEEERVLRDGKLYDPQLWGKVLLLFDVECIYRCIMRLSKLEMENFFSDHFENGEENVSPSKHTMAQMLACKYLGVENVVDKREEEKDIIEESKVDLDHLILEMCGIGVPRPLLSLIFSFLQYDKKLLLRTGRICKTFYLVILSTWSEITIRPTNVFNVSLLVLQSVQRITFNRHCNRLGQKDIMYIWKSISSTKNLRTVCLQSNKNEHYSLFNRIFEYAEFCRTENNEIIFANLQRFEWDTFKYGELQSKMKYEIGTLFPNLTELQNPPGSWACVESLTKVEVLEINETRNKWSFPRSGKYFFIGDFLNFLKRNPRLRKLVFVLRSQLQNAITEILCPESWKLLKNLESLSYEYSDPGLKFQPKLSFVGGLPKLKHLKLGLCHSQNVLDKTNLTDYMNRYCTTQELVLQNTKTRLKRVHLQLIRPPDFERVLKTWKVYPKELEVSLEVYSEYNKVFRDFVSPIKRLIDVTDSQRLEKWNVKVICFYEDKRKRKRKYFGGLPTFRVVLMWIEYSRIRPVGNKFKSFFDVTSAAKVDDEMPKLLELLFRKIVGKKE